MKIATIGAGRIGGNLARLFVRAGHDVSISNSRGPETLSELADEIGAAAATIAGAVKDADVVIIATSLSAVSSLPSGLFDAASAAVAIIDTNNYYPARDGHIVEIEAGKTESRWVADQIGRDVIKAFNSIYSVHLLTKSRTAGAASRVALPVAGDDEIAKKVVMDLIDQIGFDPVDAGTLDESWKQQPGSPVYGAEADVDGARKLLQEASPDRHPDWRA